MNYGRAGPFRQHYTKLPNFTKEGCRSWLDATAGIFASEGCQVDDAQQIQRTLNVLPDDLLMLIGAHLNEVDGDYDTLTQVLLRECEANPRALMAHALKRNFGDA